MIHACGSPEAATSHRVRPRLRRGRARGLGRGRADPVRFRDGRPRRHASPAARRQRGDLHAPRFPRCLRSRSSSAPRARLPRWSSGATGSRARWSPSAMRRPRCFTCSKCLRKARRNPPPSSAFRSASSAPPNQGRARRRSVRRALSHRSRPHRRQRHDRGRRQRAWRGQGYEWAV